MSVTELKRYVMHNLCYIICALLNVYGAMTMHFVYNVMCFELCLAVFGTCRKRHTSVVLLFVSVVHADGKLSFLPSIWLAHIGTARSVRCVTLCSV